MDKTSNIILAASLAITMWGMGLGLIWDDFKRVAKYPKAVAIGLFNQLILLPLIAFGLIQLFNAPVEIAIGIMILAACPGGPTSNLITLLAKGDTALSVSLTAVTSVVTIFSIPFIVNFALDYFVMSSSDISLPILETILQIFAIVLIPISIGMWVKHKKPAFSDRMAKPVRIASAVLLALIIIGLVIKEKESIGSYFADAGLIALSLNAATMLVGFGTARLMKLNRKQSKTISIESGIQNGTMALMIAGTILNNTQYGIAPAVYSLIMFFTGGFVIFLAGRKKTA
jgi:bile acid:Na+ symporter, BASS family